MGNTNNSFAENETETPLEGLEHLVPDFLVKRKIELKELETFVATSDFDQIRQLTHKWKGYSAPYGFGTLGTLAESMNIRAHDKDTAQCASILKEMQEYLVAKEQHLKNFPL